MKFLQPFAVVSFNLPQIQVIDIKDDQMNHHTLCVIDAPGLNMSMTEDLQHVLNIVKKVNYPRYSYSTQYTDVMST